VLCLFIALNAVAQNELAVVKAEKKVVAAQALTPLILKQQWIDKWDGKLPVYGSLPTLFKGIEYLYSRINSFQERYEK
jgi:hypothetical protein